MSRIGRKFPFTLSGPAMAWSILIVGLVLAALDARCETYGIMNPSGEFEPKVTVTVSDKEIAIKKTDPQERFQSISLQVNPKNSALIRNVGLLKIEWLDAQSRPSRAIPFTGPRYDPTTRRYEDVMLKSVGLKVLNTSTRELFTKGALADLFIVKINGEPIVSGDSAAEKGRTVQMGTGRDVSINVDRTSIVFNESNYKAGEMINVENRSGTEQILGIEVPSVGLNYQGVMRKVKQDKIPPEEWDRIKIPADGGLFIALIPDPDPAQLALLDGKELRINIFDRNRVRETRRIPIKISPDLKAGVPDHDGAAEPRAVKPEGPGRPAEGTGARTPSVNLTGKTGDKKEAAGSRDPQGTARQWGGSWSWILQIVNLVLLIGLAGYGMLYVLPKVQVLEDRLAKNEMFIHGTREAIREELDQIKEEILRQCQQEEDAE